MLCIIIFTRESVKDGKVLLIVITSKFFLLKNTIFFIFYPMRPVFTLISCFIGGRRDLF